MRFDSRGRRRATVLLAGTLLSGSGSARLGLFQKGGIGNSSHPSAHACWNTASPSGCSRCSFRRRPSPGLRRMLASVGLRTSSGSRRRSCRPAPAGRRHRGKRPLRCGGGAGRGTGSPRSSQHTTSPSISQDRTLKWSRRSDSEATVPLGVTSPMPIGTRLTKLLRCATDLTVHFEDGREKSVRGRQEP